MATLEQTGHSIAKSEGTSLVELINKSAKELEKALPEHMSAERLCRIALTCVRLNPELAKCTPASFMGALFTSAQVGIEPVAGRAYLIPFNNKRKIGNEWKTLKEAQFVLGYKGIAELFFRHEKAVQLDWGVVKENDDFSYEYGTEAKLRHVPSKNTTGVVVGYYVIAKLNNGGRPFMYMSKADCIEHGKKHSKTYDKREEKFYDSSPWKTSEDAMCLKTVLVQLSKLLPLSVELQRAIQADESSRDYRNGITEVLDMPDTTNWTEEPQKTSELEQEVAKLKQKEAVAVPKPENEQKPDKAPETPPNAKETAKSAVLEGSVEPEYQDYSTQVRKFIILSGFDQKPNEELWKIVCAKLKEKALMTKENQMQILKYYKKEYEKPSDLKRDELEQAVFEAHKEDFSMEAFDIPF